MMESRAVTDIALCGVLLAAVGAMLLSFQRLSFPEGAPKLLRGGTSLSMARRFVWERKKLYFDGRSATTSGSFSFYVGQLRLVAMSGLNGRRAFHEAKEMALEKGYIPFLAIASLGGQPSVSSGKNVSMKHDLIPITKSDNLRARLSSLIDATAATFHRWVSQAGGTSVLMNPFTEMEGLVGQLSLLAFGLDELAHSPPRRARLLQLIAVIGSPSSLSNLLFPRIPGLSVLKVVFRWIESYILFFMIVRRRQTSQDRPKFPGVVQDLVDRGESAYYLLRLTVGFLFAAQVNTSTSIAWTLASLARNPAWMHRVRQEVEAVLTQHRVSLDEPSEQTLRRLDLDDWETQFPLVDLCLRESIRLCATPTLFRLNDSTRDIPIGKTGEVVPPGAYGFYHHDDVHMDPTIYTDPIGWDPARYLPDRAEDRKVPLGYLGWGAGRHPCLGTRVAKLQAAVVIVHAVSLTEMELCDPEGNPETKALVPNLDRVLASGPLNPVRMRYSVRQKVAEPAG